MKLFDVTNFLGITTKKRVETELPETTTFDVDNAGPKEVFHSKEATSRTNLKGFDPRFIRTFAIIGIVVVLILIVLQEYFLIIAALSLIFISYVLTITPPDVVKYEITSHGIQYGDQFYYWNELKQYFFTTKGGMRYIGVDVKEGLPGRIYLPADEKDFQKMKDHLSKYLPFLEKEPATYMDQAFDKMVGMLDIKSPADSNQN